MLRFSQVRWLSSTIVTGGVLALIAVSLSYKRNAASRLFRWLHGEPTSRQTSNDLTEKLRSSGDLEMLQHWSLGVLSRFQSNSLKTDGIPSYWAPGSAKLNLIEVPDAIQTNWAREAEVTIIVSTNGLGEAICICWYLHGMIIGPPNYVLSIKPWYSSEVQPGVYVYSDKK